MSKRSKKKTDSPVGIAFVNTLASMGGFFGQASLGSGLTRLVLMAKGMKKYPGLALWFGSTTSAFVWLILARLLANFTKSKSGSFTAFSVMVVIRTLVDWIGAGTVSRTGKTSKFVQRMAGMNLQTLPVTTSSSTTPAAGTLLAAYITDHNVFVSANTKEIDNVTEYKEEGDKVYLSGKDSNTNTQKPLVDAQGIPWHKEGGRVITGNHGEQSYMTMAQFANIVKDLDSLQQGPS